MTSYATVEEFLEQIDSAQQKPADDVYIAALLERASREFDGDTQHWFYSYAETRRYDLPRGCELKMDVELLSVDALINGDNTLIPATEYDLTPFNGYHYNAIELHQDSTYTWMPSTGGRTRGVIYVRGTWGYVDRTNTHPKALEVISNSRAATLNLSKSVYNKRYGQGTDGTATITGAGVIITPRDKSKEYWALASIYQAHT